MGLPPFGFLLALTHFLINHGIRVGTSFERVRDLSISSPDM